jgi:hypothetical protein
LRIYGLEEAIKESFDRVVKEVEYGKRHIKP